MVTNYHRSPAYVSIVVGGVVPCGTIIVVRATYPTLPYPYASRSGERRAPRRTPKLCSLKRRPESAPGETPRDSGEAITCSHMLPTLGTLDDLQT